MRGGAGDPLENVKKDDLVSVVLKDNAHPRGFENVNDDITVKCRVLNVEEDQSIQPNKIVKLQLTDNDYTFCYVYGGNDYNGIPITFNKEFYIRGLSPDYKYQFMIFKRNKNKELEVIPKMYYTNIKKTGHEQYQHAAYVIKSVKPLTASQ
jgi:hypothetical protein